MRRHRMLWMIALAAALAAGVLGSLRRVSAPATAPETAAVEHPLDRALRNIAADPSMITRETQSSVRAAAVWVEEAGESSAEGYFVLGVQFQQEQHFATAEACFRRSIELAPEWSWPYTGLGTLLGRYEFGRMEEALAALYRAIELEPERARPHNVLALLLRSEGRLEEAEQHALDGIQLDPNDLAARNNYANLLVEFGRFGEAEKQYRAAIRIDPHHPKPYYNLACLHSLQGRQRDAIAQLRKAVERAPILRKEAAGDPDFDRVRETREFQELVFGVGPAEEPGEESLTKEEH